MSTGFPTETGKYWASDSVATTRCLCGAAYQSDLGYVANPGRLPQWAKALLIFQWKMTKSGRAILGIIKGLGHGVPSISQSIGNLPLLSL